MQQQFKRFFVCTLLLFFAAGQAAAFDLKIGHMNVGAPPVIHAGRYAPANNGFGAMLTMPLGFSSANKTTATLNGQDISHFTQQDAKDSLIVIMLFGVAIAAGVLTVSAASN